MKTQTYKDLIVWQKSKKLVIEIYSLTEQFPSVEKFGIVSQFNRAAISVPLNIAEGYRRRGPKERKQFFTIAFGSATEIEALIDICKDLPVFKNLDFSKTENLLDEVLRMLNVFIKNSSLNSTPYFLNSSQKSTPYSLNSKFSSKGFSLLEVLLVIGVLSIIATAVSPFLFGGKTSIEVEEEAKKIAGVLKIGQNKAMTLENGSAWGVHFNNITPSSPFYDIFEGNDYATGTSTDRYYLFNNIIFQSPASGASTTAIFNKRSGNLLSGASTTITIKSLSPEITNSVIIMPNGRITVQ